MIPSGVLLFTFEAALFGGVAVEDVQGEVAQEGEVFGGVAGAHAALILGEGHIERPVQLVLDPPMAARRAGELRASFSAAIAAFYHYNNDSPMKPFKVNFEAVQERLPEVKFENLESWAARQDWSDDAHRPSAG